MISAPVADDDDIFRLGLVDSLFALQLVLFVEQEFGLRVEGEELDLDNFCSIDAISSFVSRKMASEAV
jgi:acyl carrier protein